MIEATLLAAVKVECGKISTSSIELGDADIVTEYTQVLSEFGEFIPIKKHRYITSVANQREYTVPATVLRVKNVFVWASLNDDPFFPGEGYAAISGGGEMEYFNFPSLHIIEAIRIQKNLPRIRFDFHPTERLLKIDPYPLETGVRYYYTSVESGAWTLALLPSDFNELLILGTTVKCMSIIAMKRSQLGGVQRPGGFIDYPVDRLKPFIDQKRDEYQKKLLMKAKLYSVR